MIKIFKTSFSISVLISSVLLTGCGAPGSKSELEWENRQFEMEAEGAYMGVVNPINNNVGGPISGSVTINRDGKNILAFVRLNGGQPGVTHQQKIHAGFSCPTAANDINADGYVDAIEAMDHVHKILIPLDSSLSSQASGLKVWPVGDQYGNYWYEKSASYENFISDLRINDPNHTDDLIKLEDDKLLNLDSRVVLIYGVGPEINLPTTVKSRERIARNQSLPIACGVLRKVTLVPGVTEDDPNINLPIGPGDISGGNGSVDDGAIVPVGAGGAQGGDIPVPEEDDEEGGFRWPWESEPDGDDWPW